ncbi:MAG: ABC transporter substrate-binding protein, partial [Myxococcota bacterium]
VGAALVALGWPAAAGPAEAGTVRYAEDRAPSIVNPLFATSMSEARVDELVFEGLFADDPELRSTGRLAESFELAPDQKSMTIHLRQGVKWHDGMPFGSADVVFTIDAYRSTQTASSEAGRVTWIDGVQAKDEYTVVLTFKKPEYAPQDKLHFKILPAHKFTSTAVKRTDPFRTQPIGTGPYLIKSFNDDSSVTMVRNAEHWQSPHLDGFVMREVSDQSYQAKLLIYESLEALVQVLPRDLATLQNDRKIELYPYQTNSWWYLGFNERNKSLADVKVREAIARMVDVDALLAPIGTGDRVSGPFVPSSPYYNHNVVPVAFDADGATDLLTKAGYTFDGTWKKPDGKELKVRVVAPSNLKTGSDLVLNFQSQLQSRGITVETESLDVAAWKERVWRDHDFDIVLSQWSFDRTEDIWEQFHSTGTRNFIGYANPEVDKLLLQARGATDPQQKKAVLQQVHAKIAADHPMVFLWTLDTYAAMSSRVKNVVVHPFYFFTWATDWTLDP